MTPSTATLWTRTAATLLPDRGVADDGGVNVWVAVAENEPCVTGMLLSIASAFVPDDERSERLLHYLVGGQMADGGWNCLRWRTGATHSSLHTTINVLEGLHAYAAAWPVAAG